MDIPISEEQWDEALVDFMKSGKFDKDLQDRLEVVWSKFGWSLPRSPFDPETTPAERIGFRKSLPYADVRRFDFQEKEVLGSKQGELLKRIKGLEENMELLKSIARLKDPVAFFTGRDFRGLNDRHRQNLDGAFRAFAAIVISNLINLVSKEQDVVDDELGAPVHLWLQDRGHTYFIGEELHESLRDTDIHGDFSLTELKWPMESFCVIFPEELEVQHPNGETSHAYGCVMSLSDKTEVQHSEVTTLDLLGHLKPGFPDKAKVTPGVPSITLLLKEGICHTENADTYPSGLKSYLYSMLYVWVENPKLVERGHKLGQKVNRRTGIAAWSPNYIGRTYKIPDYSKDAPAGADGRRVRRKVRGHFKWQPHGKGRALRKRIYVEPYWAGTIEL